eukprot:COSAG02_NODE_25644_length_652_cov_22.804702_1_plen_81_part_01
MPRRFDSRSSIIVAIHSSMNSSPVRGVYYLDLVHGLHRSIHSACTAVQSGVPIPNSYYSADLALIVMELWCVHAIKYEIAT